VSSVTPSLARYVDMARKASTHPGKLVVLTKLLDEVFGVALEDLLPGIEKKIGSRILGVRGSVDLLYTSIVFEIKVDLDKELDDAKKQLKKYFQALIEARRWEKPIGIATDTIKYIAFIPIIENGVVKDVMDISSMDISRVPVTDAILWLDSYIFSKLRIRPTANDLKFRFGPGSPTYAIAIETLRSLWDVVKEEEDVKLKYELWSKNMEIVYGSRPEVNAFLDQTYLVTLVKLITYLRLSGDSVVAPSKMLKALRGEYFTEYGIMNLIEEDFFTWIIHEKIRDRSLELICSIAKELLRYDLTQIDEDFFKELYQEIVERGQRHRVGEYYTPEWLTELVLREVLDLWWRDNIEPPRILDPACGSGTFLTNSIRILKEELSRRGWGPSEILNFILTNIVGIDINPLAVTIARANYLIALGELLNVRKGAILIPVYVADSIRLPSTIKTLVKLTSEQRTSLVNIMVYDYKIDDIHLQIPDNVAKDRSKLSKAITAFKEAIESYRTRRNKAEAYKVFERILGNVTGSAEFNVLKSALDNILSLIDKRKDSIWVYMLSNIYIPIALSESKFDIIVGNPPWVIMRYIENKEYQDFVKKQFLSYELLSSDYAHLFNTIEIATLFFCRASDLYLRDKGIIGFVMPRSVLTGALQHVEFRKFKNPAMTLYKILDLEDVLPLFNVPSCVLIAFKGGETRYPVLARRFSGRLPEKNLRLNDALAYLKVNDYNYQPPQILGGKSFYYNRFKAGATIYPRNLIFIEFVIHPTLGVNIEKPYCRTSQDIIKNAKEPWKNVFIEGIVEREFIYVTTLSEDLLSFKCNFRPLVLPIEPSIGGYALLNVNELRSKGYVHTANWFEKAQKIWKERRTAKERERFSTIMDKFNYHGSLSSQNPGKRFVVLYNTSGTNIVSCVVDKQHLPPLSIGMSNITPRGFVADEKTMFYETNDEMEAHYLCAILNSDIVNEAIKPLQTRGLFGERDIVRRPFMLPIPKFDPNNPDHRRLAELSKICHVKASRVRLTKESVGSRRKEVRDALKGEIAEINAIVSRILGLS
jgi:SAM-dependent methyltransferase